MEYKGIDLSKKSSVDAAMLILENISLEFHRTNDILNSKVNEIMDVFVKPNIPREYKDILYKSISLNITKNNKSVFDDIKKIALKHCSNMIDFHFEEDKEKHFLLKNKSAWIAIQNEIQSITSL